MTKGNGDLRMIALASIIILTSACGRSQIREESLYESPMQCYKEKKIESAGLSFLVGGAIGYATYLGAKYASYGKPQIDNRITFIENYHSWGQCLDMFSGLTTHEETENADTVKYTWAPPYAKLLQISSFAMDQSDLKTGNAAIFEIAFNLKAPTDQKEIDVIQTRRLKYYDAAGKRYIELGEVEKGFNLLPGKYRLDGFIAVPEGVEEGEFVLDVEIVAHGVSEHVEMPFVVIRTQ